MEGKDGNENFLHLEDNCVEELPNIGLCLGSRFFRKLVSAFVFILEDFSRINKRGLITII